MSIYKSGYKDVKAAYVYKNGAWSIFYTSAPSMRAGFTEGNVDYIHTPSKGVLSVTANTYNAYESSEGTLVRTMMDDLTGVTSLKFDCQRFYGDYASVCAIVLSDNPDYRYAGGTKVVLWEGNKTTDKSYLGPLTVNIPTEHRKPYYIRFHALSGPLDDNFGMISLKKIEIPATGRVLWDASQDGSYQK